MIGKGSVLGFMLLGWLLSTGEVKLKIQTQFHFFLQGVSGVDPGIVARILVEVADDEYHNMNEVSIMRIMRSQLVIL